MMIDATEKHWESIIRSVKSVCVSSSQVLDYFHSLEPKLFGHVKKSNCVGDVLGAKGLNLPRFFSQSLGKNVYLIPAAGWDTARREAFDALSFNGRMESARLLEKELLGHGPGTVDNKTVENAEAIQPRSECDKPEDSNDDGLRPVVFDDDSGDISEFIAEGQVR